MKFIDWGIRIRKLQSHNYYSIWNNLKTTRLDLGEDKELPPDNSEFYDIGITTRCNACCPFCYVSAKDIGTDKNNIVGEWKRFISRFPEDKIVDIINTTDENIKDLLLSTQEIKSIEEYELKVLSRVSVAKGYPVIYTEKPFQVAIGSVGEPTLHPQFSEFLKAIYETKVVPNYTTNGIILASGKEEILEATENFCGGVAVSFGNKSIRKEARKAIENLLKLKDTKVMIHHIISTKESVDEFIQEVTSYGKDIHYHVLLPLMQHGRSDKGMEQGVFEYMVETINNLRLKNVAFGANFLPYIKNNPGCLNLYEYPQEIYSKNMILGDGQIIITPSSFDLTPIMTI